jgi:maleylacetate reductase
MEFVHTGLPGRIVFGAGRRREIGAELERLGVGRALLVATPGRRTLADAMVALSGGRIAAIHAEAAQHTPVAFTEMALTVLSSTGADGLVALGGGSALGLSKALALRSGLPQLAVPTTFAGSEMTPILGETDATGKTTRRSPEVLPRAVIYDPELTAQMPASVAGPSGLNAMAHAVEALYSSSPLIRSMAEQAIAALGAALPPVVDRAEDNEAQERALYGAWLAGMCLGSAGMAIHHKLAHVLGGLFDLPHADLHAVLLPYTTQFNAEAAPAAMTAIARALDAERAGPALHRLLARVGGYTSLGEFGLVGADLDRAADAAVKDSYANPQPVTRAGVRGLLQAAFEGQLIS